MMRDHFTDYANSLSAASIKTHSHALANFVEYMGTIGILVTVDDIQNGACLWEAIKWDTMKGYLNWLIQKGYAVASINQHLSVIRSYVKLAAISNQIDRREAALILSVSGYAKEKAKALDGKRETTRIGHKKASHIIINDSQAQALKTHPDTPQGRRDAVLMCLLLDHGLRAGEVAALTVGNVDLANRQLVNIDVAFTDELATVALSPDTVHVLYAWFDSGDAPVMGSLLRGSRKGGYLTKAGISTTCISERVRALGARLGIVNLSANDCRHYWLTHYAPQIDVNSDLYHQIQELKREGESLRRALKLKQVSAPKLPNVVVEYSREWRTEN